MREKRKNTEEKTSTAHRALLARLSSLLMMMKHFQVCPILCYSAAAFASAFDVLVEFAFAFLNHHRHR